MNAALLITKRFLFRYSLVMTLLLAGCTPPQPPPEAVTQLKPIKIDEIKIVVGQTIYVPIYSHIYTWDRNRTMDLTAMLSIRNTDPTYPIIVTSVNYFNSDGKLTRQYLEHPVELGAMASTNFVVSQEDRSGGSGAAFVVEWVSPKKVALPVIESVMINTSGNQGISFISPGRVIKSRTSSQ